MLQQGYQSWSFSGAVQIPEMYEVDDAGMPLSRAPLEGDPLREEPGVSYGTAALGEPGKGPALALGALSARRATTAIGARRAPGQKASFVVLYGAAREALLPDADGVVRSEPLALVRGESANDALDGLRGLMAEANPPPRRPPGGWYSWNERFEKIDAAYIDAHAALVQQRLAPLGLPLVEIDDGWEVAWGDWRANERFAGGMEPVIKGITDRGLIAGIWMAPFLVDVTSDTAKNADPAWFVQDEAGKPRIHRPPGSKKDYLVLDGTSGEGMRVATDAVAALAAAGVRYFKFDFLYAGAIPGRRSKAGATGNEALLAGFAALRSSTGSESVINACGAPILPVIGWADSLRIGTDTAFAGVPLRWPLVAFAARSHAARAFLWPLIWPDADQVQVRAPYSEAEARAGALATALAGPAYALGDDLTVLDESRLTLALAPDVLDLALSDSPARAVDPLSSPVTKLVTSPVLDLSAGKGETAAPPPAQFSGKGKSGARYSVRFTWSGEHGATVEKGP